MFLSAYHFFNVLIFLDMSLAILCCILLIKVPMKYAIKFVTIPLVILSTYMLIVIGEDIFGRPYDQPPVGKFEFIDYRIDIKNGTKRIELWVVQEKKSRLHIINYNEIVEQELSKAKTRKSQGSRQRGEFSSDKGRNGGRYSLSIGDIPLLEILPPKN